MNAHDQCNAEATADAALQAGLTEALRPLFDAIEKPELRLHSVCIEGGIITAMIELHDSPTTWMLCLPIDAPTGATLTLVSHA